MNGIINQQMKLVEFSGNEIKITTYNSSTGTIASPISNTSPKPVVESYNKMDVFTRVNNIPVQGLNDITKRSTEIVDKVTKHVIVRVNSDTLDTNSTSYNADMDAYHTDITSLIIT